jgi:tripartite-type tricarboxylate transporter receptor subunit TctC
MDGIERRTFWKLAVAGVLGSNALGLHALTALATMLTAALIVPPFAAAQDKYPSRPVKIVQTLPAGTSPDIRARIIAEQLTRMWGQQVVVENRPGGGGAIGVQAVLSAPADGYTLLAAATSTFTILPVQKDKSPIDVNRDLVPIGITSYEGLVIAASPKLGINKLADLIALAKREPHKIVIGTNAAGTLPHFAARLLVDLSKAPFTVLPYATGGTNQAIADILGGRVHVVIETRPGLKGALDSGDLKALAIMSSERVAVDPALPTAVETVPGLIAVAWTALAAPKGTPEAIIQQLSQDLRRVLEAPDVRTRFEQIGSPFRPILAAEAARFIEAEQRLWWPIVKAAWPK